MNPNVTPRPIASTKPTPIIRSSPENRWAFNEEIGIFLTRRCPLHCAHCIVSSHASLADPPEGVVLQTVRRVAGEHRLKHVSLTGGEPFLRPTLLRECCAILRTADKYISVVTSAHWAATPERARHMLEETLGQQGDVRLWLSLDPHHSQFLPATHYANAIEAAADLGFEVGVKTVYNKNPEEGLEFVRELLLPQHFTSLFEVYLQPLFLLGRAENLGQEPAHTAPLPEGICGKCVPHISDEGQLIACCGVFDTTTDNPLNLGDVKRDALGALLNKSEEDWLIQAIRTLGPARLAKLVAEDVSGALARGPYLPHDICALCNGLMSAPKTVQALRERLSADPELRRKIALMRFALYGEHRMLQQTKEKYHGHERSEVPHR